MEVSALTHSGSALGLRGPNALLRLQSDERLIGLTRQGNHAAFETLCSRYQSRLLSFCRHMLGSREDAEDVLQEVFASAFNAVLADEREINVRPWLYRIARNRSLNHLRRASAIGVDSMDVHFAEHGISTGDRVLRRESFRELIADVHDLPETQRTALLLREIDALSYEQIAQAMETTVPSVKSLLVRARISLAEAAEARKLSCEEVRLELGEAAEGLRKLSTPARRHVRGCERCAFFKKQLRETNHALAAILPVGPLVVFKNVLLTKLGSAGGAHVAGGAGATMGAGASASASAVAGAGAVAGATAGGAGVTGGLLTAGAGAIASKAVAGLAAAAIVTAGAVAADHAVVHRPAARTGSAHGASASAAQPAHEPLIVRERSQPLSGSLPAHRHAAAVADRQQTKDTKLAPAASKAPAAATVPAAPAPPVPTATPVKPADPPPAEAPPVQVTQVTSETTALPSSATSAPAAQPASEAGNAAPAPNPALPTAEPVPPAETVPPGEAAPDAGADGPGGVEAPPEGPPAGSGAPSPPAPVSAPSEP
jgi:RNA polymerase sigma factor (sigma-70 family)